MGGRADLGESGIFRRLEHQWLALAWLEYLINTQIQDDSCIQ
jgi:hypothetical protein